MAQTFNDGDPIDASIIQNLVTEVNNLKSRIPQIGEPKTVIDLGGSTSNVVIPQIYGTRVTKQVVDKNGTDIKIDLTGAKFTATPKAVTVTPYHDAVKPADTIYFHIISISKDAVVGKAYLAAGSKRTSITATFYCIAIQHA